VVPSCAKTPCGWEIVKMLGPGTGPNGVLVKVHAYGIGSSDIRGNGRSTGRRIPPVAMGR
jgi:hypothetical protein